MFKVKIKIKPSEKFFVVLGPPIHKRVNKGGGVQLYSLDPSWRMPITNLSLLLSLGPFEKFVWWWVVGVLM